MFKAIAEYGRAVRLRRLGTKPLEVDERSEEPLPAIKVHHVRKGRKRKKIETG
jgi:hypothetical protein